MYGVITRNEQELEWTEFDRGFYEVKEVTGREGEPVASGANAVSCFGDNASVAADPSLVATSDAGEPATRERPYFDWSYVCPSREAYREGLLSTIADCAATNPDVRLDDVGFPRAEYCHCDVCEERFEASEHDDWREWRASVVTSFVERAAERVPGRLSMAVHPDPYPGHLDDRAGIDLDSLSPLVDEFVVPLYDTSYGTTYWLEALASGFADRLDPSYDGGPSVDHGASLGVELYAVNVAVDDLVSATRVADAYAEAVYFGYDAGTARAVVRRMRAEDGEGRSYG